MKAKFMIFLAIYLISQVTSLAKVGHQIVHENAEYPKVCPLKDGNNLVLSSQIGYQKSLFSKFDTNARETLKGELETGSSISSGLVESKDDNELPNHLISHNRQNIPNHESKEYITSFDGAGNKDRHLIKNSLYKQTSSVALKNGKIIVAGIVDTTGFGAETRVEVNIYDPKNKAFGNGKTLTAHSNFISCYEQRDNEVYCVYVSYEDIFLSKLAIKRLIINDNTIEVEEGRNVIKVFYTAFNFLKAIKFNDNEALILFQTGNGNTEIEFGNKGKDLYLYQISVKPHTEDSNFPDNPYVEIIRYEYLFDNCLFREDPEYYNADVIALSQNRIYATCESEENKLYGFAIYLDKKKVDRFFFNNFDASEIKNPVFTKFEKNLALFYTHKTLTQNYRTAYMMINYPDCEDYEDNLTIPKFESVRLDKALKVFMMNSYPASRQNEKITARIVRADNMTILNADTNKPIDLDQDFDPEEISLKINAEGESGDYFIEFRATRDDPYDGKILGRTCKIKIEIPECLPQCKNCPAKGTEEHNYCIDCADEMHTPTIDQGIVIKGYAPLYNCNPCNESCTSCFGKFIEDPANTNCKRCDYEKGYYPFELDSRICISERTQSYWEKIFGRAIFLDKTDGNEKEVWKWSLCHEHCKKCAEKGDDFDNKCIYCIDNWYFYCNQTEGHGIPGSCHNDCKDHGFYISKEEDGREKCCPCLLHCEKCQNETKCDKCEEKFYRDSEAEHCDEDCGYCLAKDDTRRECVNCKTSYSFEKYNLDGICVNTLPSFNYSEVNEYSFTVNVTKLYHIVDETCNLIDACKKGCKKCSERFSDKCTECEEDYYQEDPFNKNRTVFECYSKKTCQGVIPYPHRGLDSDKKIGGVPIEENIDNKIKKVCLNCKQRNDSYRLPEDDFYCGEKINFTYVDIPEYNKLSKCYYRCKECDTWGSAMKMNCQGCRDSKYYDIIYYDGIKRYGNCYRKAHKCGIYPYYHDYDLSYVYGRSDDDCGEDCDVCLYNFTCTEKLPYLDYATHECVEFCPITDVLESRCNISNVIGALVLLRNPFGLRNPYDFLNTSVTIQDIISSRIFTYISKAYPELGKQIEEQGGKLGKGQYYNLPESQIIIGNNISFELTTFKLELQKLQQLMEGGGGKDNGSSVVDLSECEAIIKKKYGLSDEEDLMIIKGDLLKQLSEEYLGASVEYQLFSTSLGAFLPLSDCQDEGTTVTISNPFDIKNLASQFASKVDPVLGSGYNIFDVNDPFFNDVCTPFTNENGNDVLLDDRRKDYFNENINLCESGCKFVGYNTSTKYYTCACNIKVTPGSEAEEYTTEYITKEMPENFKDYISKRSNIAVFKCASQVFSASGQKKNFGSYCLIVAFASFIGVVVYHFIKEKMEMYLIFSKLGNIANPPKPTGTKEEKKDKKEKKEKKEKHESDKKDKKERQASKEKNNDQKRVGLEGNDPKTSYPIAKGLHKNPKNIHKEIVLKDEKLNFASYKQALSNDKRTFTMYYWSLLKMKQLFIFTFYTSEDYILRTTKIALFILFICFYFAFTALFFTDSITRALYIYKGNTNAAVHVPNIILSSFCSIIMCLIVRFVSLSEKEIYEIYQENNPERRKTLAEKARRSSKIKTIILYVISGLLIGLCWYYVSAFCAVFKNSQGNYFINLLVAFIVCNIWPCVTSLIPALLRTKALKDGTSETLYNISRIISIL